MKLFSRLILYYIFACLIAPITTPIVRTIVIHKIYPQGYIYNIDTKHYSKDSIKIVLNEFNEMGNDKIVRFKKDKIDRKITIVDSENIEYLPFYAEEGTQTIGLAEVTVLECKITLKSNMDHAKLRRTLIHEYLHCMGYGHVENDYNDLMAPMDSYFVSEKNIENYAKELEKRF